MLRKTSPVTAIHACADNDRNGNPRRCFVLTDHKGRHVETIDEGYYGEAALYGRYPWFHFRAAEKHGLRNLYVQRIDVSPSEYKRLMRREPDERCEPIRKAADRYQRKFDAYGDPRD